MTGFLVATPIRVEPVPDRLLGLGLAERARRMLEAAGMSEASGDRTSALVLYPGELVGPAHLGIEIAEVRPGPFEVVTVSAPGVARPVLVVGAGARAGLGPSPDEAFNAALPRASRRVVTRTRAVSVIDRASRRRARRVLLDSLRKPGVDGLVSRTLNRPVSLFLSSLLVRTPVTPNQLSIFTFLVLLGGAALMATGRFVAGALVLQAASILDGCDGEVARLRYRTSSRGSWLDTVLDDAGNQVFSLATGWGLMQAFGRPWGPALMALSLGTLAIALPAVVVTYRRLLRDGQTDSGALTWDAAKVASPIRRFLVDRLQPIAKRDGYYFLFMLLALAGVPWLIPVLFFAGASAVLGTVVTARSTDAPAPSLARNARTGSGP